MSDIKNIIEKINHLRRLSTSNNPHEAAAAAAIADQLIQEHDIAEAQLEAEGRVVQEMPVEDVDPLINWVGRVPRWKHVLALRLIKHYGCTSYSTLRYVEVAPKMWKKSKVISVIGRRSDVEALRYMYAYLSVEVERLASAHRGLGRSWLDAYRHGVVGGCLNAMEDARQVVVSTAHLMGKSTALAIIDARYDEALRVRSQLHPELKSGGKVGTRGGPGYWTGVSDGEKLADKHNELAGSNVRSLKS